MDSIEDMPTKVWKQEEFVVRLYFNEKGLERILSARQPGIVLLGWRR
jgi:hypothetical protein